MAEVWSQRHRRRFPVGDGASDAAERPDHRALNLFRSDTGELSKRDLIAAQAFADVATIGILQQRAVEEAHTVNVQLSAALNSRVIIEQAKGMVAERTGEDMASAFNKLRGYARSHNVRLSDLAAQVVAGTLDVGSFGASSPQGQRSRVQP